jgi:signal peptidase I
MVEEAQPNVTELKLGLGSAEPDNSANQANPRRGSVRRVTIAAVLSLLAPGLGQVYVRRPWRGLVMAFSVTALGFLSGELRLWLTFAGVVSSMLVSILLRLYVVVEAGYLATNKKQTSASDPVASRTASIAVGVVVLLLTIFPTPDYLMRRWGYFRAFKVPSASMCPTICEGDRIVANMEAFAKSGPSRGDVIMMKHQTSESLYIKRVIGVGGDSVSSSDGHILVNGHQLAEPGPAKGCEQLRVSYATKEEPIPFDAVTVPPSSFFVIGDNLSNSYDSRIQGFGLVTLSQVRGKPLFIYWSPNSSRIGCSIR